MVRTTPVMYGAVEDVEQLTPQLVRVILGGDGLAPFVPNEWSDSYLNLLFVPPDAPYTVPFDADGARKLDRARWPIPRRYTVRSWDSERRRLAIDFVVHGETGLLAPERDAATLAEHLVIALGDGAARERMGAAGRRRVLEHFDHRKQAAALAAIYDEARAVACARAPGTHSAS